MFDKPSASHVLGIEIDGFSLKSVALDLVKGKPHITGMLDFCIKPLYTSEQKHKIDQLLENHLIATAMSTSQLLVRPLDLKLKKKKDIESVLVFQAEPLIPYPIENALLDKLFVAQDKENTRLTVLVARKDHVEQHIKEWNELDVEPEIVSAEPHALAVFAKHVQAQLEPYYVLHLGIKQSLCILVENGFLIASQSISEGIEGLITSYSDTVGIDIFTAYQDLIKIDITENETKKAFDALLQSVTRTIYSLTKQIKGKKIDSILITGVGAAIPRVVQLICQSTGKESLSLEEPLHLGVPINNLVPYAIPLGIALTALPLDYPSVNFRQKELAFPAPWKRLKKPLTIYFSLCIGLAIALSLFGSSYLNYREAELKSHYLDILNVMNLPYSEFEKSFADKQGATFSESSIVTVNQLTAEDLKKRLIYLDHEIQSTPQMFPLQPNVPLVSDVLAWVGSHPNFVGNSKEDKSSLEIESFEYTMVKRPEPAKKSEKYQVKIELEFSSPSPKKAREFHDALITPNDMVDSKAEIKWNSTGDKYRTSFYLKDKTFYPTI